MGTLSYSVGKYGTNRGQGAGSLLASKVIAAGTHTTSGTASDITSLTVGAGHILRGYCDAALRITFDGTASASTGHYCPASQLFEFECTEPGAVSVIEV